VVANNRWIGVPQGYVLGPKYISRPYCSPVGDVITNHGVHYYQYADDTHLRLAVSADNTAAGLSVYSCRVYRQRQTVVPAERTAAQPVGAEAYCVATRTACYTNNRYASPTFAVDRFVNKLCRRPPQYAPLPAS